MRRLSAWPASPKDSVPTSVPHRLRCEARRFRTLAEGADVAMRGFLLDIADDYEAEAERLDNGPETPTMPEVD